MSNTAAPSQSLPVTDRENSQPGIESATAQDTQRFHPLRLQHSPSLPNIWFPPHSRPFPYEMNKDQKPIIQHPSAPSSPKPESTIIPILDTSKQTEGRPRHVKYASIETIHRKGASSVKSHARRRTERDQPHSLLTPPLTPSSSIRTSASRDSGLESEAQQGRDQEHEDEIRTSEEVIDSDPDSTRILLLGNVNRRITVEVLETAIHESLSSVAISSDSSSATNTSEVVRRPRHPAIKGVNQRYLHSEGIVPVVFFDVRASKAIMDLVVSSTRNNLHETLGEVGEEQPSLTAQLVAADDLSKRLGHSNFLESVDGSFYLSVQKINYNTEAEGSHMVEDITQEIKVSAPDQEKNIPDIRGSINGAMLHSLLKSFGSMRIFTFSRQEVNEDDSPSLIYHVEYHDSRDAENAYNDLEGHVMFGMKLGVSGKPEASGRLSQTISAVSLPFPNVTTAGESFEGLAIGTAGLHSQIRTRFQYSNQTDNASGPQGDLSHSTLPVAPVPNGAPSPTFFYASSFASPSGNPYQGAYQQRPYQNADPIDPRLTQRASDTIIQGTQPTTFQDSVWDVDTIYRSDSISPCYTPDGICLYCPSKGVQHSMPFNPGFAQYSLSAPPTTPPIYYPAHLTTPHLSGSMIPGVPQGVVGYEYMDPQMQPMPNGPWAYDPAIASIVLGPSPAPYFIREDPAVIASGRQYHPEYIHSPEPHLVHHMPYPNETPPAQATDSSKASRSGGHLRRPRSSSPSSNRSNSCVRYDQGVNPSGSGGNPLGGLSDRNQLNLVKMEEGSDTRTTVMIKNIPNKMSDSDLTAYIGKVCPRRIDFLYLRMDFQNGCNVGYAFVNFIHVQDLLRFAKARLGEKWNMFSSEKVLQMSYANYQGKEALVEKFKNSAIMDERESWRPRIFFSSGSNQGLPEPFPAPTHIRRKERSSYNRGALFVPGVNGHGTIAHPQRLLHNTTRRYQEDYHSQRERSEVQERPQNHHGRDRHGDVPRRGITDSVSAYTYRTTR